MFNPKKHHRRSIRLKGYEYSSPGAYFVTICTYERECLFGEIMGDEMQLNAAGRIASEEWIKSSEIRGEIELDSWQLMPNHLHAIVFILETPNPGQATIVGAQGLAPQKESCL